MSYEGKGAGGWGGGWSLLKLTRTVCCLSSRLIVLSLLTSLCVFRQAARDGARNACGDHRGHRDAVRGGGSPVAAGQVPHPSHTALAGTLRRTQHGASHISV